MNWKLILRIIISITLLIGLFTYIDMNELLNSLQQVTPLLVLVAVASTLLGIFVSMLGLKILLDIRKKVSLGKLSKYSLYSWAASQFFLGKLGTFSIIYFLNKEKISWKESSVFITVNQLVTAVMLFPLAIIGIFIFFPEQFPYAISLVILLTIGFFVGKKLKIVRRLKRFLNKKHKLFIDSLRLLKDNKERLWLNLLVTFIGFVISVLVLYFFFWNFGYPVAIWQILIASALVTFLGFIPISLAGLGIHEVSSVYFFSLFGIPGAITLSIYILFRICKYIIAGLVLLYFAFLYE
tara:strand:+ start:11102 stop:11986 length:885 start_codon:yes stop_codon:yes gene_type:complete